MDEGRLSGKITTCQCFVYSEFFTAHLEVQATDSGQELLQKERGMVLLGDVAGDGGGGSNPKYKYFWLSKTGE